MNLSAKAIQDLKLALVNAYGTDFELQDEALQNIGLFLLVTLSEVIKLSKDGIINTLH